MAEEGNENARKANQTSSVQVAVRVRPLNTMEVTHASESCIQVQHNRLILGENQERDFTFDAVYPPTADQETLYELIPPLIDRFFDGYNATVFAYGQTGSGKTFTMGNEFKLTLKPQDRGIIPRVMQDIFGRIEKADHAEISLTVSYLEILNEEIHDLLATNTKHTSGPISLNIRDDGRSGVCIAGLSQHQVESLAQVAEFLHAGTLNRKTASTNMNATSSRSHAICTLTMEQYCKDDPDSTETRFSKFHLVDLAGSERAKRTNTEGSRFREGVNINKGLLSLGNVINALCERERMHQQNTATGSNAVSMIHIPYRDSKLTRLLQDSLGGNSKTLMVACVSPADVNYDETLNTLRYAARARQIQNQAIINREISPSSELICLRKQIEILQLQLLQQKMPSGLQSQYTLTQNGDTLSPSEEIQRLEHLLRTKEEEMKILATSKENWKRIVEECISDKAVAGEQLQPSIIQSECYKEAVEFDKSLSDHCFVDRLCAPSSEPQSETESAEQIEKNILDLNLEISQRELILSALRQDGSNLDSSREGAKEELLQDSVTENKILALASSYTQKIIQLENEVGSLTEENKKMAVAAQARSKAQPNASKLHEQLKNLQDKLSEARKAERACKRLAMQLKSGSVKISTLESEMMDMKRQKATLQRQLKEQSEAHRKESRQQQLRILQLKRQEQRKQYELQKLSALHTKQNNVLKRKSEEVAAVHKRMRSMMSTKDKKLDNQLTRVAKKDLAGPIPSTLSNIIHETVEVQGTLLGAANAIKIFQNERKELALQIGAINRKPEPTEQDKLTLEVLRKSLSDKNKSIHALQEKLAAVEMNNPISGELFPAHEQTCHQIIKCLLHHVVETKAECADLQSCQVELHAAEEKLIKTMEAYESAQQRWERGQQPYQHADPSSPQSSSSMTSLPNSIILRENVNLRKQLEALQKELEAARRDSENLASTKKKSKTMKNAEPYDAEDIFMDDSDDGSGTDSEYVAEDDEDDEDYVEKSEHEQKRPKKDNRSASSITSHPARTSMDEIDDLLRSPTNQPNCCNCNGKCATRACNCRAGKRDCGESCSCHALKCQNRAEIKLKVHKKNSIEHERQELIASISSYTKQSKTHLKDILGKENIVDSISEAKQIKKPVRVKNMLDGQDKRTAAVRVPLGNRSLNGHNAGSPAFKRVMNTSLARNLRKTLF